MPAPTSSLFSPVTLGNLELPNRLTMAPLTRTRAIDHQPNALMAEYYAQRASAGLIITEATQISPEGKGYAWTPGIHSDEQVVACTAVKLGSTSAERA